MKKIMFSLFLVFTFIFCVLGVSAATTMPITCGSNSCSSSWFKVVQLTSGNVSSSSQPYYSYINYFDYTTHKSYWTYFRQSSSTYNLPDGYSWSSNWSSSSGFSTFSDFFNRIDYSLTGYAGTYVYLVKQVPDSAKPIVDGSEYIVYVTVNTYYSITSITAKKIKDFDGKSITATSVSELSFQDVSKTIEITCGSASCETSKFSVVQLTDANTYRTGTYGNYRTYFDSTKHISYGTYYASIYLNNEPYMWETSWGSSGGFYTGKTIFNSISYSNGYYGTYAFLLKQEQAHSSQQIDLTEYIVYVTTNSSYSVVSIQAKRIKNSSGQTITATPVSELSFSSNAMDLTTADFYIANHITGTYADVTLYVDYRITYNGSGTITAYIYNQSGQAISTVSLSNYVEKSVSLYNNQYLVVKNGEAPGSSFKVYAYSGLEYKGYNLNYKAYSVGSTAYHSSGIFNIYSRTTGHSGANGDSYIDYTWNYPDSNIPATGVDLNITPYIVIGGMSLLVVFYVMTSRRRRTSFDYEEQ